jgi:hypothetical protein
LYANCTNNDIDSIVDECHSEGFEAFYVGGTCKNDTGGEPGDSQAAEYCNQLAADNQQYSIANSTCECIPNAQGGT